MHQATTNTCNKLEKSSFSTARDSLAREVLDLINGNLEDPKQYEKKVGYSFARGDLGKSSTEINAYANFILSLCSDKQLFSSEQTNALEATLAEADHTALARTMCSTPLILAELSPQQLEQIASMKPLPLNVKPSQPGLPTDFTAVRLHNYDRVSQTINILGGHMSLVLKKGDKFDFVPNDSLNATHAFDPRLTEPLSEEQKRQAKLDFTNALLTLARSSQLQTSEKQLIPTHGKPGDENTALFQIIETVPSIETNVTNKTFAEFLGNKFQFEVKETPYGHIAKISAQKLVSIIEKIEETRGRYLSPKIPR